MDEDEARVALRQDGTVTMRFLNQHTAEVIQEVNDTGRPAIVTRHGRFVAVISPLVNRGVEEAVLSAVLSRVQAGSSKVTHVFSGEDVAAELDLNVPAYPERNVE